jgi:hypothetical protein
MLNLDWFFIQENFGKACGVCTKLLKNKNEAQLKGKWPNRLSLDKTYS